MPCVLLMTTYRCPAACRHCSVCASPECDGGQVGLEDVRGYLRDLKDNGSVDSMWPFGGEPFLDVDLLVDVVGEIIAADVSTGVLTNGFWGEDEAQARHAVQRLQAVGLDCIAFSVDAYHQEFVPLASVKTAIRASRDAGISRIDINAKSFIGPDADNEPNRLTKRYIAELQGEFEFADVRLWPIEWRGRATDQLPELLEMVARPLSEIESAPCPRFEGLPFVWIDPAGRLSPCPGIVIGNAKQTPPSEIVAEFDSDKHPITAALATVGPQGLLELAVKQGYEPLDRYGSKCHVCFDVRRFLHPSYPGVLAPAHLYKKEEARCQASTW